MDLAVTSPQFSHLSCDPAQKRASKPRSAPFTIDMRGTGADQAKGGEGNADTDLEVVGEVGVVAAAAGLQVGEAVQLRAHQQRVVHHLRRVLLARFRAPGSVDGRVRSDAADGDEEGQGEWAMWVLAYYGRNIGLLVRVLTPFGRE